MLASIFEPFADFGPLILRLGLAGVFIAHGLPKLNPNSDMKGIPGVTGFFNQLGIPFPGFFAWVVGLLEVIGPALLVLGLGTRIIGFALAINMAVAIYAAKIKMMKAGFTGQGGWEFEFALLFSSIALAFTGAGRYSLDAGLGL
jgi:putative oxidoreductase